MKRLLFIFFISSMLFAQVGYVEISNPVYDFLARMDAQNLIDNYDQFELPKTRKEIAENIKLLLSKRNELNSVDREKLNDFIIEFEFEIYGTVKNHFSLFTGEKPISNLTSDKEKFLYYYTDTNDVNLFVNFVGEGTALFKNDKETSRNTNSTIVKFGGIIRGSLFNRVGFSIFGTNGTYLGDQELALSYGGLGYNYKLNVPQDGIGDQYFDDTRGYLMADFDYVKLKIGRDKLKIGYGPLNYLMGSDFPPTDYVFLNLKYKALTFSFYHMKLLGSKLTVADSTLGEIRQVDDKYWVYHRLGINFSKHFTFGIGEVILYANRNIDFSYLNPFNFYKSTEHANQDRDNSMLFMDFTNNSIDGLKFFGTFLMDDVDFGKIGTGWYGNKFLLSLGAQSTQLNKLLPLDVEAQYVMVDPYVYAHHIYNNNYTSLHYPLVSILQPNSENFILKFNYRPHYRLDMSLAFFYSIHGANDVDEAGNVITNYGGDILVGHRTGDSETVTFLDGRREYFRQYSFTANYEFINNYNLKLNLLYDNSNLHLEGKQEYLKGILTLSLKI